jgi:hypothetical protein
MNAIKISLVALFVFSSVGGAQSLDTTDSFWNVFSHKAVTHQSFEAESLFPMFFTGGYHYALGYRYERFRIRVSVINGGSYDAEPAGLTNSKQDFKRFYKPSPGLFLGYNVWNNLDVYAFLEGHTFRIEQKATGVSQDVRSIDYGGGVSYQLFIGKAFYVQPGLHLYLRDRKAVNFSNTVYRLPGADLAPVIRIGARLWESSPDDK